jgi:CelD/BcsL family acetyltransferase involved in cellulose biosynthesis
MSNEAKLRLATPHEEISVQAIDKLRCEIIQKWPGVYSLGVEWNAFLSSSRADNIFLTWEWINAWAQIVGESLRPSIVVVRNESQKLVGVAPFYFTTYRLLNTVRYRVLRIMGDSPTGAEYGTWIAEKGSEKEVSDAIANALVKSSKEWDCIWMPNVPGWTGVHPVVCDAALESGFYCHTRTREFSSFDLPKDIATFYKALSENRQEQLKRQMSKSLRSEGVQVTQCTEASELPRYLEALFNLHYRRWKVKGEEGSFRRKPLLADFYGEFAKIAFDRGWLRLFALSESGQFKAIQIGYVYNNIFHQLQEGFDPDYVDGVGNVLRFKIIESLIQEGVKEYDFLGGMSEHKRRWGAKERTGYDIFIGHRSLKNRILFAKNIWPTGRFLKPVNLPGQ